MIPKRRKAPPDTTAEAHYQASSSHLGLLHPEISHVLEDFAQFQHPESRRAFADQWITKVAGRLQQTWPVFYQLLKIVETEQLYGRTDAIGKRQTFPTFQAYWEATTGRAFEEWVALEQTYAYSCTYRPELLEQLYATAKLATQAQKNTEANAMNAHVGPKHLHIADSDTNHKDVTIRVHDGRGNTNTYALRRLAKDCPELHAQCLAGELTPHAAMVQAGLRKKPPSRKRTPLDMLHYYWRQVSPDDRLRFLVAMLTREERTALSTGYEEEVSP